MLCKFLLLFAEGKYPEVELLDCMVVLVFAFLRNLRAAFHTDRTNVPSHQQSWKLPFSPHSPTGAGHLLTTVVLTGARRYLAVVFFCVSLTISDTGHLLVYL